MNRKQTFRIKVADSIFAAYEKKYLLLAIEDNGIGFPEEILPKLNGAGPLPQADTSRLGVQNVIQRMHLRYCGEVKISFTNAAKGGAVVELLLPLQQNQTMMEAFMYNLLVVDDEEIAIRGIIQKQFNAFLEKK